MKFLADMKALRSAGLLIATLAVIAALPRARKTLADGQSDVEDASVAIPNGKTPEGAGTDGFAAAPGPQQHDSAVNSDLNLATLEYPKEPLYKALWEQLSGMMRAIAKLPGSLLRAVAAVVSGRDRADFEGPDSGEAP